MVRVFAGFRLLWKMERGGGDVVLLAYELEEKETWVGSLRQPDGVQLDGDSDFGRG